ncbi:MAG: hypothetical protein QOG41_1786 [Thermoleophilaceae bacterium]|nr:hypothetical protein [Thermoleophilaceae bacterium]
MTSAIPYDQSGRVQQKARTRAALLAAARELLAEGVSPSVEQAADRAAISRTTAYRYFPNRRSLIAATFPVLEQASLLGDDPPDDVEERLERLVDALTRQLLDHEPEYRAQLRLSLEPAEGPREPLALRQGRAIGWLEDALAPLRGRLPKAELRRLVLAIRATIGIEAFVWLTDVGGVSRDEAVAIMRSSALSLLRVAGEDAGEAGRRGSRRRP